MVMTAETGVGHHVSRRFCKFQIQENLCLLGFLLAIKGINVFKLGDVRKPGLISGVETKQQYGMP